MFQLRSYQQEAVSSLFNYFGAKQGNPVIAMPTGTGKSLVIAGFVQQALVSYPSTRVMMLTHVKELIDQNAGKLQDIWPNAPVGIYSAGLNQRDTMMPITFGGSASVVNCVKDFGRQDLLIIDECHLLSPKADTTYQVIINELKETNPHLKVVGLSATPYRIGQGKITDDGIFTDICCDMTGLQAFNWFISNGYLAPLIPKRVKTERQSDTTVLGANGDFSSACLEADAADKNVTYQCLIEACEYGVDRQSWLAFASTIEDADFIADTLCQFGIASAAVHSKKGAKHNDESIRKFKDGRLRCLVNMGKLTTGFDHPALDMIIMLRRTMSPGLWVQMLGRGTRMSLATQKENCLVLDFAGNTRRLGPINDPVTPRKKGKGGGDAPVRICNACSTYNHASARQCVFCGEEFTFAPSIVAQASELELIKSDLPVTEWFEVTQVHYFAHEKEGTSPSIKVTYYCNGGFHRFNEYVKIEGARYDGKKARDWWRARFPGDYLPTTVREALEHITQLRVPRRIQVWTNKKYPEVIAYEY